MPNGRLVYDASEVTSIYIGTGSRRRLLQDDGAKMQRHEDRVCYHYLVRNPIKGAGGDFSQMPEWCIQIALCVVCLGLCKTDALAEPANQNHKANYRTFIRFQIENDRVGGTDDDHTQSLRLFVEWPDRKPSPSISINYESLTHRNENTRVDLLGIDAAFAYPVWRGGRFAFSGGVAINGDLGGQALQNGLHSWLNEASLHLAYPDSYSFGLTTGVQLDQKLTEIGGFRLTGAGETKVASKAGPSWVQGGIYLDRQFIHARQTMLEIKFGISANSYFWLDEILKSYYDKGYSLDSRLRFGWKWLAINVFYFSNPYGIDQGILGVGFGFLF